MKRFISLIIAGLLILPAMAQDYVQSEEEEAPRKTSNYFPERGDMGIGFDATPFLDYAGNMFNGTTNNSLNLGDNTLYFRYFLDNSSAVRAALRINSNKNVNKQFIDDDAAQMEDPLSEKQLEDHEITTNNQYELKLGYQMFRGENRLRGFYGADVFLRYQKSVTEYEYGNEMTVENPEPSANFVGFNPAQRDLERNNGTEFSFGLGAFCGAEYYLMPKVALGTELGVIYARSSRGQSSRTYEEMIGSELEISDEQLNPGNRNRSFFTTFPYGYGSLYLVVHF